MITSSASRVADFKTEYEPPAPFSFKMLNENFSTLQNEDFKIDILVTGDKLPENVSVNYNGKSFYLTQDQIGKYSFVFEKPAQDFEFYLQGNEVRSATYPVTVGAVPVIQDFKLALDYPSHTGKKDETISSTGNATIPQGTKVEWKLATSGATAVNYMEGNDISAFERGGNEFAFAKAILQPTRYSISTSNDNVKDYENLSFKLEVTKDEFPEIDMAMKVDSVDVDIRYFKGQVQYLQNRNGESLQRLRTPSTVGCRVTI